MKHQAMRALALLLCGVLSGCEFGVEGSPVATGPALGGEHPLAPIVTPPATPRVAKGDLRFVEGYRQGYDLAGQEGKPMLVFFTAEWCHFCHQMADEAFTHPQVVSLSEHFICVLIDADREPDVCRQFQVQGYPTIQFLSPRGVPLERIVGKKPGHQLMMSMQAALQTVARRADDLLEATPR